METTGWFRPLRYGVAQSLDGYIAPPDESTDWIVDDPTIDFDAIYASFDGFVMGRKTYEIVTADKTKNPLHDRPKASVVVISRTLKQEDHPDVRVISEGYIEAVRDMKAQIDLVNRPESPGGLWLMGGGGLAAEFLAAGLLDGVDAAIMPVILGGGIKIFTDGLDSKDISQGEKSSGYSLKLLSLERLRQSDILMTKYDIVYD